MKGYKTYLIALVGALYAVSAYLTGHVDLNTGMQLLVTSLGLAALRNGIANQA